MPRILSKNFINTGKQLLFTGCLLGAALFSLPAQAQSTYEDATLSPGFAPDPKQLKGTGGGTSPAREIAARADTPTGECVGFAADQPGHTLELKAFFKYLAVSAQSQEDTTIVIKGPGGTWCNDDYDGKNAGVSGQWLPGTYQIWVGSFKKGGSLPYMLRITETR
jgi:hypothetical protein